MTCGPKNTTHRVPWPLFWAGHPPGVPLRPATVSCCISSPCCDMEIQSLSSQQADHPDGPAKELAPWTLHWIKCCGSRPRDPAPSPWAWGDGAELSWACLPPLAGGGPTEGDISPCTRPAHPVPRSTGALLLPAVGLVGWVFGEGELLLPCLDGRISQSRSG